MSNVIRQILKLYDVMIFLLTYFVFIIQHFITMASKYSALKELCWCTLCCGNNMRDSHIIAKHVDGKGYHSQSPQLFINKYRAILEGKQESEGMCNKIPSSI